MLLFCPMLLHMVLEHLVALIDAVNALALLLALARDHPQIVTVPLCLVGRGILSLGEILDHQTRLARSVGVFPPQECPSTNVVCELVDKYSISGTILRYVPRSPSEGPQKDQAPASHNSYPHTSAPFIGSLPTPS